MPLLIFKEESMFGFGKKKKIKEEAEKENIDRSSLIDIGFTKSEEEDSFLTSMSDMEKRRYYESMENKSCSK